VPRVLLRVYRVARGVQEVLKGVTKIVTEVFARSIYKNLRVVLQKLFTEIDTRSVTRIVAGVLPRVFTRVLPGYLPGIIFQGGVEVLEVLQGIILGCHRIGGGVTRDYLQKCYQRLQELFSELFTKVLPELFTKNCYKGI
jgi:hypothetical protein